MPCFTPLKAYRAQGGQIVFDSRGGWSDRPLELPCGQCVGCRLERSRQWALRCVHEAQMHERNSFVTLTYSPANLPADGGLHVEDWQKFAKRLRKAIGPFRFFHCGEYGPENLRPHYHALLFGEDFSGDRVLCSSGRGANALFRSRLLEETWGHGFVTLGAVTFESAAYVARYVMKKATGALAEERYVRYDSNTGECWEVRPEYVTMSRRPGIGASWFEKFRGDVFPADEVVYGGRRYRPPRYYTSKLPEDVVKALSCERRRKAALRAEDLTPERLRVREQVAEARLSRLERKL